MTQGDDRFRVDAAQRRLRNAVERIVTAGQGAARQADAHQPRNVVTVTNIGTPNTVQGATAAQRVRIRQVRTTRTEEQHHGEEAR